MKVALIGYGKMGKTIEKLAIERGFSISMIIDKDNQDDIHSIKPENTDVAIEFTMPQSAFNNLSILINNGVKTVCGTTGWLDNLGEIKSLVNQNKGTFLYASNFSIGVNLFFEMNEWLASKMNGIGKFSAYLKEIHHTEKKDAPSGTAITIAEGIIKNHQQYSAWALEEDHKSSDELKIKHHREGQVPGTHSVFYNNALESIEIKHTAHDRKVFAEGVIEVAEWVTNQTGMLTIKDYLKSLV